MDLDLYIDVIFFVNFFMDLLLLILLKRVLRKKVSWGRLGAGAVLGGFLGCLEVWGLTVPGFLFALISLIEACLLVFVVFGWRGIRELVKETITLFILAVMAGGVMEMILGYTRAGVYAMNVLGGNEGYVLPLLGWIFLAAGVFFLVQGLWQLGDEIRRERKNLYALTLRDGDVAVDVTGYLDTGNCLQEPGSGEGVHIVTKQVFEMFQDSKGERALIPFHTIGNPGGLMEGVRIEMMEIAGLRGKARIKGPWIAGAPYGLSKKETYQVLLYGETAVREDKKGGIASGH